MERMFGSSLGKALFQGDGAGFTPPDGDPVPQEGPGDLRVARAFGDQGGDHSPSSH